MPVKEQTTPRTDTESARDQGKVDNGIILHVRRALPNEKYN